MDKFSVRRSIRTASVCRAASHVNPETRIFKNHLTVAFSCGDLALYGWGSVPASGALPVSFA